MTHSFIEIPDFLPCMSVMTRKKQSKSTDLLSNTTEAVELTVNKPTLIPGRYSTNRNTRKQRFSLYSLSGALYLKDDTQLYPIPSQWTNIILGLQSIEEREFQWIRQFSLADGVPKITAQGFFPVTAIQQMQYDAIEAPASDLGVAVAEGNLFYDLSRVPEKFTFFCMEPNDNLSHTHILAHGAHPYEEKAVVYYIVVDHSLSNGDIAIRDVSQLTEGHANLSVGFWQDSKVPEKLRARHEAYKNFDYPNLEEVPENFPMKLRACLEQLQSCSRTQIFNEVLHFKSQKTCKQKKRKDVIVTRFDTEAFRELITPQGLISYPIANTAPSFEHNVPTYGSIVAVARNSLDLQPGNYFTRVAMALAFNGQMLVRVIFEPVTLSQISIEEKADGRFNIGFNTTGNNYPNTELQPRLQFYAASFDEVITRFEEMMPSAKVMIAVDSYYRSKEFTQHKIFQQGSCYWTGLKLTKGHIKDLKTFSTVAIKKL